jgi:S1-C subfamily serine protease
MRRFIAFGPAFVVLITTLVTLVAAPAAVRRLGHAAVDNQVRLARASLDADDVLERLNAAVRNIARAVEPSVVHIQWDTSAQRGRMRGVVLAQGSGWVYDDRGHIVTNAHVITDPRSPNPPPLIVQFHDGRRVPADVVGKDTSTDVAVIKVRTTEGLVPAARATGLDVNQGDRVYAFGSPFGFKFSMSEGIVSGLGRDPSTIIGEGGYTNYIQSDAAVNPGNSGGPLVDIKGRVVGMNVAIATAASQGGAPDRGQSAGISFAIPLDTIESVVDQLVTSGRVAKGYLGINLPEPNANPTYPDQEDYNRMLVQSAGFRGGGVMIRDVPPDGPAAKAGLEPGDIVVAIKGRPVSTVAGLRQSIAINRPGDPIDVRVYRAGGFRDFKVTLGDLTLAQRAVQRTNDAVAGYGFFALAATDDGILIQSLRRASAAAEDGFRPGQVIKSIEGRPVTSGEALLNVLIEKGFADGNRLTAVVEDPEGRRREITMQYRP